MKEIKITFRSIEKQVCSLNLAKRLHEIGVRQDTYFHWIHDKKNDLWEVCWSDYLDEDDVPHYAAFTAQDLVDLFFARNNNEWKFYHRFGEKPRPLGRGWIACF